MDKDIIFIGGIDWYGKYKYSTHHIVERLARGNRVFYIDNFGGRRDVRLRDIARVLRRAGRLFSKKTRFVQPSENGKRNPVVIQPVLIPTPRLPNSVGRINVRLLRRKLEAAIDQFHMQYPVIWNFVPTDVVWKAVSHLPRSVFIYQSVDNFAAHPLIPRGARERFAKSEEMFAKSADLVFVNARNLLAEKIKLNPRTYFFPNGVDVDHFRQAGAGIPAMEKLPKPVIGFAGLLGPWIDFDLLADCAGRRPHWSFALIGSRSSETPLRKLADRPNVHFTGAVDHAMLPSYFKYFDAGIIPYQLTEFTRYTFPSKMAEYLAAGLPVVSTALPEVEAYASVVNVVHGAEQMVAAIESELVCAGEADRVESRLRAAKSLSWDTIVGRMEKLMDEIAQDKV